ncbi:MAG: arabinofuranosidase [Rhodococcus sp. (in: high G+C Gram-positive bacteria)]
MPDTATVKRTKTTFWTSLSTVLLTAAALVVGAPAVSSAEPGDWRYTMVSFSNTSDRDLDVYASTDGTDFQPARLSAFRPESGLVRDPSIFRHTDGMYYLTYTTGGAGANIGFARSSDRVNWTPMGNWPIPFCCALMPGTGDGTGSANIPGFAGSSALRSLPSFSPFTTKAWAPEWFVDGDRVNVIVSLSTGGGFVPYVMTALDPALTMWSLPVPLGGIGADHIDTTVVKVGPTYHAFTKNETEKIIEHAVAPTLLGPYSYVPAGDWGPMREGPAVAQMPNGDWRIFFDAYTEGKYFYSDSSDGLTTWSEPQELPGVSGTIRHVGVMREPA